MMLEMLQITSPIATKIANPVDREIYLGSIDLRKALVNTNSIEFVYEHKAWHKTNGDQERIYFIEVWFTSNTCTYFNISYEEFKRITTGIDPEEEEMNNLEFGDFGDSN